MGVAQPGNRSVFRQTGGSERRSHQGPGQVPVCVQVKVMEIDCFLLVCGDGPEANRVQGRVIKIIYWMGAGAEPGEGKASACTYIHPFQAAHRPRAASSESLSHLP